MKNILNFKELNAKTDDYHEQEENENLKNKIIERAAHLTREQEILLLEVEILGNKLEGMEGLLMNLNLNFIKMKMKMKLGNEIEMK